MRLCKFSAIELVLSVVFNAFNTDGYEIYYEIIKNWNMENIILQLIEHNKIWENIIDRKILCVDEMCEIFTLKLIDNVFFTDIFRLYQQSKVLLFSLSENMIPVVDEEIDYIWEHLNNIIWQCCKYIHLKREPKRIGKTTIFNYLKNYYDDIDIFELVHKMDKNL